MRLYVIRLVLVLLAVGTVLGLLTLERAGASSVVCVPIPGPPQDQVVCVTIGEVGVNPPNPTPEDSIEIIVSGTFSAICPMVLGGSHSIVGNQIFIILIGFLNLEVCSPLPFPEPWSVTEPIGQLPPGDYTVEVTAHLLCNGVLCGVLTASTSFSVDTGPPFRLDVSVTGSGTVTGPGINCRTNPTADPAGCTEDYNADTPVSLTATPDAGSVFAGWGGDCAEQGNPCHLTMDADKSVTATFGLADTVTIRNAVFLNPLSLLLVSATSTAAPDATLTLTVPGCITEAPMTLTRGRYVFFTRDCTGLDGQTVMVISDFGGSAEAVIR